MQVSTVHTLLSSLKKTNKVIQQKNWKKSICVFFFSLNEPVSVDSASARVTSARALTVADTSRHRRARIAIVFFYRYEKKSREKMKRKWITKRKSNILPQAVPAGGAALSGGQLELVPLRMDIEFRNENRISFIVLPVHFSAPSQSLPTFVARQTNDDGYLYLYLYIFDFLHSKETWVFTLYGFGGQLIELPLHLSSSASSSNNQFKVIDRNNKTYCAGSSHRSAAARHLNKQNEPIIDILKLQS